MVKAAATIQIALLEDEEVWVARVEQAILPQGWALTTFAQTDDLIAHLCREHVDLVILDRMLGSNDDRDGLEVISQLQAMEITVPTLVLSALSSSRFRANGLDRGADDYLSKPFDPDELRARVEALLRRSGVLAAHAAIRKIGDLEIRTISRTATCRGRHIRLPEQCFALLDALSEDIGSALTKDQLWKKVWPDMRIPARDTVIEVAISRLRKLLIEQTGKGYIENQRGRGYSLTDA